MLQNHPGGKNRKSTFLEVSKMPGSLPMATAALVSLCAIRLAVAVLVSLRMISKYSLAAWCSRILKIGLAIFLINFSSKSELKCFKTVPEKKIGNRPFGRSPGGLQDDWAAFLW